MTCGAEIGNIARKGRRLQVSLRQNSMRAMAVSAGRGIGIALIMQLAMDALFVLADQLGMTDGTVHRTAVLADRIFILTDIYMAFDTCDVFLLVDTASERSDVDKEALFRAVDRDFCQVSFTVTTETELIVHAFLIEHPPGPVRGMALDTDRDLVGFLFP